MLLEEDVGYDQCFSLGKTAFSLLHFVLQGPNLLVTAGFSCHPTFAFQSPMMERTFFFLVLVLGLIGLQRTIQFQLL